MAKSDIFESGWVDIVFEGRNHEYGAYELRKKSGHNTFLGVVLSLVLGVLVIVGPRIVAMLSDLVPKEELIKVQEVTTLEEPPPVDKDEPPPPPVEPPPPLKSTVQFTPPVIKPDEEVPDEPPPTQEQLKDVDAGAKTEEGDPNGTDASLIGDGNAVVEEAAPTIFTIVEKMPSFPGGDEELFKYLAKNIKYPPMEKDNGISGTVYLKFVIGPDGNVSGIEVQRGVKGGPNLEQEAIRVVKSMPPWTPGVQNGKKVSVYYNIPIKFTLK